MAIKSIDQHLEDNARHFTEHLGESVTYTPPSGSPTVYTAIVTRHEPDKPGSGHGNYQPVEVDFLVADVTPVVGGTVLVVFKKGEAAQSARIAEVSDGMQGLWKCGVVR